MPYQATESLVVFLGYTVEVTLKKIDIKAYYGDISTAGVMGQAELMN